MELLIIEEEKQAMNVKKGPEFYRQLHEKCNFSKCSILGMVTFTFCSISLEREGVREREGLD